MFGSIPAVIRHCEIWFLSTACNPLTFSDSCQAIDQEVKTEIEEAVERSKTDPEIPLDELYKDIYSGGMEGYGVRGCDPMTIGKHN